MKKLIATLVLAAPAFVFAQELPNAENNQNENPFKQIATTNQVSTEYIDISQMAAVLNISNETRSATHAAQSLVNIPRELIDLSLLTDGLKPDNEKIKALLNK